MLRHLLIAEDHPLCASALSSAAQGRDSAIVVDICDTLHDTQAKLATREYDAILLDLGLKDSDGLINLTLLRSQNAHVPILIVSAAPGVDLPEKASSMGAQGYLNKQASLDEMADAIEAVMDGKTYFPTLPDGEHPRTSAVAGLSRAQMRVMHELATGHSNKIIAYNLGLAEATVKSHLSAIYRALRVTNRSEAILTLKKMHDGVIRA